jgi:drug/metabolite transporter (DMT)-like permease
VSAVSVRHEISLLFAAALGYLFLGEIHTLSKILARTVSATGTLLMD